MDGEKILSAHIKSNPGIKKKLRQNTAGTMNSHKYAAAKRAVPFLILYSQTAIIEALNGRLDFYINIMAHKLSNILS